MVNGRVTTSQMSEEERLAYIAKHPVVRTKKPSGLSFSGDRAKAAKDRPAKPRIMDAVDKELLHKQFMLGIELKTIADCHEITLVTLNNYLKEQRAIAPEKWPRRTGQLYRRGEKR